MVRSRRRADGKARSADDDGSPTLSRRHLLAASGTGLAGMAAGCTGGDGGGDGGDGSGGGGGDGGSDGGGDMAADTPQQTTVPPSEQGTVHVITDYSNDVWQERWKNEIIPGFDEEYGIDVNLEFAATSTVGDQRVMTLIQAGDPPTIYTSTFGQVGRPLNQGWVKPVDRAAGELADALGESFFPQAIRLGGKAYFLPRGSYNSALNFRRDLYDELSLEAPETWDELTENVKAVHNNTDVTGIELPVTRSKSVTGYFIRGAGGYFYRWADEEKTTPEIWFPEDPAIEAAEFGDQLAEYSNDPSSLTYEQSIRQWVAGRNGHAPHLNMWIGGVAYRVNPEIGLGTDVVRLPKKRSAEPPDYGVISPEGGSVFNKSTNPRGGELLFLYMHRTPDVAASSLINEPMRFIPSHPKVIESDTYQNDEFFQVNDNYFLEKNMEIIEDIQPHLSNTDVIPYTHPAVMNAGQAPWEQEFFIDVIITGESPKTAYDDAYRKATERLDAALEQSVFN